MSGGTRPLTDCPECGQSVSTLADACPECGTEVSHSTRGIGWWVGALLILGAAAMGGYRFAPGLSSLIPGQLGLRAGEVPPEELNVGKLDAYRACQDELEGRLETRTDTDVSLIPGWVSPAQVTNRLSARRFRVENKLGYSVAGRTGVVDVKYECEVRFRSLDDWSLEELIVEDA